MSTLGNSDAQPGGVFETYILARRYFSKRVHAARSRPRSRSVRSEYRPHGDTRSASWIAIFTVRRAFSQTSAAATDVTKTPERSKNQQPSEELIGGSYWTERRWSVVTAIAGCLHVAGRFVLHRSRN